jgi:hypothetical protein
MSYTQIWIIETEVLIHRIYFEVIEASLWDNIFAPYYLTWGGMSWSFIEFNEGFSFAIPMPLFILVIFAIFIVIIKLVIPLWLSIPKAAGPRQRKIKGKGTAGLLRAFKGG